MAITWNSLPSGKQFNGFSSDQGNDNEAPNNSMRLDFSNLPNGCNEYALGAYIKIDADTPADEEISLKLGGGKHSGNVEEEKAKKGRCYDIGIRADGSRIRCRKEFPHPKTHNTGIEEQLSNISNLRDKWVGVLGIKMTVTDKATTGVHLMVFIDTSTQDIETPANNWQQILDVTDNGNWDINLANGTPNSVTEAQIKEVWLTPFENTEGVGTIRVDQQSKMFSHKHDFLRQIQ